MHPTMPYTSQSSGSNDSVPGITPQPSVSNCAVASAGSRHYVVIAKVQKKLSSNYCLGEILVTYPHSSFSSPSYIFR